MQPKIDLRDGAATSSSTARPRQLRNRPTMDGRTTNSQTMEHTPTGGETHSKVEKDRVLASHTKVYE